MGIDESLVQEIVRQILSVTTPDRIIIFGSAAMGEMPRDSDIDLLIVEPDPGDQPKPNQEEAVNPWNWLVRSATRSWTAWRKSNEQEKVRKKEKDGEKETQAGTLQLRAG